MTIPAGILSSSTQRSQQHQHYNLKRTTSTFCVSQLAAQQSAVQPPNASFAPGPIASSSSTAASHSRRAPYPDAKRVTVTGVSGSGSKVLSMIHETCVDVNIDVGVGADEEEGLRQKYHSREEYSITTGEDAPYQQRWQQQQQPYDQPESPLRSRSSSRSRSSLSTSSSSSSVWKMNRSSSCSSAATSASTEDDDDNGDDDEDDDKSSMTSFSLSNTSRSSKHSTASTYTSFSLSSQRHIFFLPPTCDDDENFATYTPAVPSIYSRSSSPRRVQRKYSKSRTKQASFTPRNTTISGTPATITEKYDGGIRPVRSPLFSLVDEEVDAIVDKIERLAPASRSRKNALLALMLGSEEWADPESGDDRNQKQEKGGKDVLVRAAKSRGRVLKPKPSSSLSLTRRNSPPMYHAVGQGEDPLTAVTPPGYVVTSLERRRGAHSRSSSTTSTSTVTSISSPTSQSSPSSPISLSPLSSICSPLQAFLHVSTPSSPLAVELETGNGCELVTYLESRSVPLSPTQPSSSKHFTPISAYISLPPPSFSTSSDRQLRPMRFGTPWQHISRSSAQRALLAPRASARVRMGARVIKDDERWGWGGMSVFSGERGTESFLPGPKNFLDMDEYEDEEDEEHEWEDDDDDDDEDDKEDEFLLNCNSSLHPQLRSHSQLQKGSSDPLAALPIRPTDSFLLPSSVPLPPLPFHPYFSPSQPTITPRRYVYRTRQASDPLFHRAYALENWTAMKRRIPPPRPFMDPEHLARMRMRMHSYGYGSALSPSFCGDDIPPELEDDEMMYGGIRWRSEAHRAKLLDRYRPLYTLYNNARDRYDETVEVEEEIIREGLERKCEIGRWVALSPGGLRLRVGSALRNVALGAGAPDV